MPAPILEILRFVADAFLRMWPYLLVTIPLAVAVRMSGASRHIHRAFAGRPAVSILLATAVGAFSPFCSCGVIPVIASLLLGGVPLAPVMSFWIASPSMDPETFFLSVAALGWELALWRLGGTLALSLAAGFLTHLAVESGWLAGAVLRPRPATRIRSVGQLARAAAARVKEVVAAAWAPAPAAAFAATSTACYAATAPAALPVVAAADSCSSCGPSPEGAPAAAACSTRPAGFGARLLRESWDASLMVARFMALAFVLEALFTLYVPAEWVAALIGRQSAFAVATAALVGVPLYTSNLAALPLVGGLLSQGMDPGAALAFLIAGPTTTIPAMAAVWGLVQRRVFALYVGFALLGAIAVGGLYGLAAAL